jgi:hypothetical protein
MAKEAMDKGTDGKPMPTDKLARAVTTHIKSLKGKGRGVGDHGEAQGADENQNDDQNDERDAIKDVMDALGDAIGVVQKAAGRIIESGKYPPQAAGLQMDVDRIGQAHLDLLGLIVRHDPNSMVIPMARRRVVALAKVVGLAVVEPAASEQQEARQ